MGNSEGEGGGFERPRFLKKSMKLTWNFPNGGGIPRKIPSLEGVWIFPGTTHLLFVINNLKEKVRQLVYISVYVVVQFDPWFKF